MMNVVKLTDCNGITVSYTVDLNGGGTRFGRDFTRAVRSAIGPVDRVLEWCAGPGFIGFGLLGDGLCQTLCLSDVNPKAVEYCRATIAHNGLEARVDAYVSDALESIPAWNRFDLIVGNPPHCGSGIETHSRGPRIIYMDEGWAIHKRFFAKAATFLMPGGSVLLQENAEDSSLDDFVDMITVAGLVEPKTLPCLWPGWPQIYYLRAQSPY